MKELKQGTAAIGHVRYATAGGGGYENVQPLVCSIRKVEVLHLPIMVI